MPLTALLDGEPVYVFDHDARSLASEAAAVRSGRRDLRCKECDYLMVVVMPTQRVWHFRHAPGTSGDCLYESAPESEAHRLLKRVIYDTCRAWGWAAEVEWRVPGTNRRADVWARDLVGRQFTFEVQLSQIPDPTCHARSIDHLQAGMTPVWLIQGAPRGWAFPDGAKRVRIRDYEGTWVLTGPGDVIYIRGGGWVTVDRRLPARVLPVTDILRLLDAPAVLPFPGRSTGAHGTPRALPCRPAATRRPLDINLAVRRPAQNRPPDKAIQHHLDLPEPQPAARRRFVYQTIDRLRCAAMLLSGAPVDLGGNPIDEDARAAFRNLAAMPTLLWVQQDLDHALSSIWAYRLALAEHGGPVLCCRCGYPMPRRNVEVGYHEGRCWRPTL